MKTKVLFITVILSTVADTRAQFPATISPPAPLNTNAASDTGGDFEPQIASDGQGHWVAVWASTDDLGGTIGSDTDILVTRSSDNGATWTAPAALNGNAGSDTGIDEEPRIATDGHGTWLVVWESNENLGGMTGTDLDILFARSTNNGETWTPPAPLNTDAATDTRQDFAPRIATDGQGNWVIVWYNPGATNDVHVARSDDNGGTWSALAMLNTPGVSGSDPSIATDRQGHWVAVWDSTDPNGGMATDILFARSTDNGANWTAPMPLNTDAATNTAGDGYPDIAMDAKGNAVAIWQSAEDYGALPTDFFILSAHSSDGGATWSDPILLNNNAAGDFRAEDESPSITTDGRGNWVAVWDGDNKADGTLGTDFEVWVTYSSDNGATWTAPTPLNSNAAVDTGGDFFVQIVADGRGNWVGVWKIEQTGTDTDVFSARFALPDCNNNGVGDGQDIADGTSTDCNGNGIPDDCETDTDGDGIIDACDPCPDTAGQTTPNDCGQCGGACGMGMATMTPITALAMTLRRRRQT